MIPVKPISSHDVFWYCCPSCYPTTIISWRNSSNPMATRTINMEEGRINQFRGDKPSLSMGTTRTYTPRASEAIPGKTKDFYLIHLQRGRHTSKQCQLNLRETAILGLRINCFMANLSYYGSDALAEVHNHNNMNNNMLNQVVQAMPSSEQLNAAVQNSNTFAQQDALILSVIEQLKTQVVNCTKINLDNKSINDTLTAKLERYKEQVNVLKEGQNVDLRSNDTISDSSAQSVDVRFKKSVDYQFEKVVNASRAKKLEKSHDPLALVAHTGSSSKNTSSYYVTHPTSVVDYEDEYQQDNVQTNSEDPLASAMLLLARSITQNFSNPTNNRLRTSSNTKNQAIIQGDRVNIQTRNSGNTGRNTRRAYVQEEVVEGSNAQNETENVQRTLRTSSSGNTSTVQCYNCSGKGHYARNCPKLRV
ncbi:retrovirus-related pol polyprotein from transposon TNT 1-94 [Tanacetum coccineum]